MKKIEKEPSLEKKQTLLIDAHKHKEIILEESEHIQQAIDKIV